MNDHVGVLRNGKFLLAYAVLGPLLPLLFQPDSFVQYLRVLVLAMPPVTTWMAFERVRCYRRIWQQLPEAERRLRVQPRVVFLQPLAKVCLTVPAIAFVLYTFSDPIQWFGLPMLLAAELLAISSEWVILDSMREQAAALLEQ